MELELSKDVIEEGDDVEYEVNASLKKKTFTSWWRRKHLSSILNPEAKNLTPENLNTDFLGSRGWSPKAA